MNSVASSYDEAVSTQPLPMIRAAIVGLGTWGQNLATGSAIGQDRPTRVW